MPRMMMDERRAGMLLRALCLLAAMAAVTSPGLPDGRTAVGAGGSAMAEEMRVSRLVIETARGPATFQVELAATPAELVQGLQHRRHLAPGAGMLFDFGTERIVTMWMKNTYIPLDMLFIDGNGIVAEIVERTEPLSMETIASRIPVRAVLEVNAGTAARLGIRPGDRVRHPIFPIR